MTRIETHSGDFGFDQRRQGQYLSNNQISPDETGIQRILNT